MNLAFEFRDICKSFGETQANKNVSFSVAEGSIHGVVGENGAGKSTIMKILYGMYPPDSGDIYVRNELTKIVSPHQAIQLGIGMVHQHFMLVPTMTVWQNIILGSEPSLGAIDQDRVCQSIDSIQHAFGFSLNLNQTIEQLPVGHQQQVEILKLLYRKAKILILDEPTAVLTPQEVDALFSRLKTLQEDGHTIVLITHKLREILSFTNRVTVMREGRVVGNKNTAQLDSTSLCELIVGRKLHELPERKSTEGPTNEILTLSNLTVLKKKNKQRLLDNISFSVNAGEIVGIAGVEGNGQGELLEVLSHVNSKYKGKVQFKGQPYKHFSTYGLKQAGLGVIPADRLKQAVVLEFSLSENLILGHHWESSISTKGWAPKKRIQERASPLIEKFDVRPNQPLRPIRAFSGGNQQKAVVAREISKPVELLLAAHPTRGVDIGAIEFIHSCILELRAKGAAILLISSELEEILALSDRIIVLYAGKIAGQTPRSEANEKQLGLWMTGASA